MIRSLLSSLLIIFLASLHLSAATGSETKILSQTANSITVQFSPGDWQSSELNIDGQAYTHFRFDGAMPSTEIGGPQIPSRVLTFGIPQNGDVSVQVLDVTYRTIANKIPLPVPEILPSPQGYIEKFQADPGLYNSQEIMPQEVVNLAKTYVFRRQRVARIVVQPLQFLAQQKSVRQYDRIVFQLNFISSGQPARTPQIAEPDESWYRDLLVNYEQAKQWRIAKQARLAKGTTHPFEGGDWYKIIIATEGTETKEGFFKVTGTSLSAAGIPIASVNPTTIQVFNNGGRELPRDINKARPDSLIETPIIVVGGQDGKLDADDYILFYARSLNGFDFDQASGSLRHYIHHYSRENVLWLTYGKREGKRIAGKVSATRPGMVAEPHYRHLVFLEEETTNFYRSGEEWLGAALSSSKRTQSYLFSMPAAVPGEETIIRTAIAAATPGNHDFKLRANGNSVADFTFSGTSNRYVTKLQEFSTEGVLLDGNNTFTIEYQTTADNKFAYVDWIEVEYARKFHAVNDKLIFHSPLRDGLALYQLSGFLRNDVAIYDVTDHSDIRQITGVENANNVFQFGDAVSATFPRRYVATTPSAYLPVTRVEKAQVNNLRTPRNAEMIIITYDDFEQQARNLESLRENWNTSEKVETEVVKISEVINEFGWGIQDPTAIRDFLAYAEKNWGNPQYVLLLGDGHYDYKNNSHEQVNRNLIIPFETESNSYYYSRTTDDWFTYTRGESNGMQMAIGRIPVQTVEEAQAVTEKIINYETKPSYGEWRKTLTIVGDDELVSGGVGNETLHTEQAEALAEDHVPDLLDVKKIYLMEYPAVRAASVSGVTKPLAKDALLDQINRGTLMINFIGHGNEELWTHENVLYGPTDFAKIQNGDRTAWWVAATCEFAYWDLPEKQSLAEKILAAQGRGAVGLVSSARLAFAHSNAAFNYAFYDQLFQNYEQTGLTKRIGDAVMLAKVAVYDETNSEKYGVFGDPCMRLGAPRYHAVIDDITPDSIQALRRVSISGHIEKDGQPWSDYEGKIQVRVFDSRKNRAYKTDAGRTVNYKLSGNSIFKGVAPISGGQFQVEFIVPKDISYGGSDGRISLYFWNDESEGTGTFKNMIVGGTAVDLVDHEGPKLHLHFGNPDFAPGDYAPANPTLVVEISDSLSGVNIAGDIGHQIIMILDQDYSSPKDLTEFFQYDEGSFTSGKVTYPMRDIEPGEHTIQIKAWDNSNNSSIIESAFTVLSDEELNVRNPLNYPNPMKEQTTFTFELSRDAEVTLKIFSVAGRLLKEFEPVQGQIGYNIFPETWDGTDQDGDKLANGIYLYKIIARAVEDGDTKTSEKIQKLIIAN